MENKQPNKKDAEKLAQSRKTLAEYFALKAEIEQKYKIKFNRDDDDKGQPAA